MIRVAPAAVPAEESARILAQGPFTSALLAPLPRHASRRGALFLAAANRSLDEDDLAFAQALAAQLSPALAAKGTAG